MSSRRRRLKPLPTDLRKQKVIRKQYARFYGNYTTRTGKMKRFSFKVKVDPYKRRSAQYILMKLTSHRLKNGKIPPVPNGFTFDDFGDLLNVQDWINVKKVHQYKAGMHYER